VLTREPEHWHTHKHTHTPSACTRNTLGRRAVTYPTGPHIRQPSPHEQGGKRGGGGEGAGGDRRRGTEASGVPPRTRQRRKGAYSAQHGWRWCRHRRYRALGGAAGHQARCAPVWSLHGRHGRTPTVAAVAAVTLRLWWPHVSLAHGAHHASGQPGVDAAWARVGSGRREHTAGRGRGKGRHRWVRGGRGGGRFAGHRKTNKLASAAVGSVGALALASLAARQRTSTREGA
jgi:hypothetical protein